MIQPHTRLCLLLSVGLIVLAACSARYRLDLYEVYGDETVGTKVERTEFLPGTVLNTPFERDKIVVGEGNCIVLYTGSRGKSHTKKHKRELMTWDQYRRYELYLQLPSRLEPTSFDIVNNAFVQLLGSFEKPVEDKVFFPTEGLLTIDSVAHEHLFGTVDATFENASSEQVGFRGQFKARVEN